ncbi:hypothetical protein GCM10027081_03520 [Cupriavidus yeoncheonensis]
MRQAQRGGMAGQCFPEGAIAGYQQMRVGGDLRVTAQHSKCLDQVLLRFFRDEPPDVQQDSTVRAQAERSSRLYAGIGIRPKAIRVDSIWHDTDAVCSRRVDVQHVLPAFCADMRGQRAPSVRQSIRKHTKPATLTQAVRRTNHRNAIARGSLGAHQSRKDIGVKHMRVNNIRTPVFDPFSYSAQREKELQWSLAQVDTEQRYARW